MYKLETIVPRGLTWTLGVILTAGTVGATEIEKLSFPCQELVPIKAGETWRSPGGGEGSNGCFEVDVATAGLLLIELSTPHATAAPPRLMADGADKLAPPGEDAFLVKSSATSWLVSVAEAGSYRLRVAAGDPRLTLPSYKLRTAFLARDEHDFKENEGELEDEPDPIVTCTGTFAFKENEGELEDEPDPIVTCTGTFALKENEGELEDEPDPFMGGPLGESRQGWDVYDLALASMELRQALAELCVRGEADDHGGSTLCATPLGPGAALGEIQNPWGDDEDVFRFDLAGPRTVEISTRGTTDTMGELYDRHGNRLGHADGGGEDGNFRMVRTLSPGAYFVRVAGERYASGPYVLTVRTSLR